MELQELDKIQMTTDKTESLCFKSAMLHSMAHTLKLVSHFWDKMSFRNMYTLYIYNYIITKRSLNQITAKLSL